MELRHLRYFSAAAQTEHLGKAADALQVTQSTMSHQIRDLEKELGVPLFNRVGRGIRLTQAGETFAVFAQQTLQSAEAGCKAIADLENLQAGHVRVGIMHPFLSSLAPLACATFNRHWPSIQLSVAEHSTDEIEHRLITGELDFGIAFYSPENPDIAAEFLFNEALKIIVAQDHPLAGESSLSMSDLPQWPLALLSREFSTRQMLDATIIKAGNNLNVIIEMNSVEALLQTVRLSQLATVLPERTSTVSSDLITVPILNQNTVRRAGLLWSRRSYRSRAAQELAQLFRSTINHGLIK